MRQRHFLTAKILFWVLISLSLFSCDRTKESAQKDLNDFRFLEKDIAFLQQGYQKGDFTIREVVESYLQRIREIDQSGPSLHSIITVNPDAAKIAEKLDEELKAGKSRGPLHGIPVVLKDNIDTHDKMPTTAGSRALMNSYPLKDSFVAKKLREAGAVIIGKANLSEWANFRGELSSSGWSGYGGQTKNPYVLDRNPCGSSSGSAVAVSANLTMVAVGTETNGSVVCPSHANGIVGIKPTVGLVSRSGIIPISYTQDTAGPMAKTVRDAAVLLGAMAGIDPADAKTAAAEGHIHPDYTVFLKEDGLKGKRIGLYTEPLGNHFKVDALMKKTVEYIKSRGAEVIEIDRIAEPEVGEYSFQIMLHEYKDGLNAYFKSLGEKAPVKNLEELIAFNEKDPVELKYFNQKYLKMAQETDGTQSETYRETLKKMLEGSRRKGIDRVMKKYKLDAIMAPTGGPAWKTDHVNGDSFHLGSSSPAARAGYPNITVPMGFIDGLPVGISFFGKAWSEPTLLEIAYAFEQGTKVRKAPNFLKTD